MEPELRARFAKCMDERNSPPESGGVARRAGVVPRLPQFGLGTTPREIFDLAALLT